VEKQALITVIVPVYNTAQYLAKCVDSILAQTWTNLEVFLVDDGSTDDSADIVKSYQQKYPHIVKAIFQKNSGQASARNAALDQMSGAYLSFVDSDDWILPEMHTALYKALIETDAQIAISDFQTVNEQGEITGDYSSGNISSLGEEVKGNESKIVAIVPQVTGKLFDAKLFEHGKHRFPEGIWYEDLALLPLLVLSANRITKVESFFYRYFKREGSITTSFTIKVLDALKALEYIENNLTNNSLVILQPLKHRTCYITIVRLCEVKNRSDRNHGFNQLQTYIKNNLINTFNQIHPPITERIVIYLIKFGLGNLLYKIKNISRFLKF
jgi:glycosyltransferase involved in cell wall biosynthesis